MDIQQLRKDWWGTYSAQIGIIQSKTYSHYQPHVVMSKEVTKTINKPKLFKTKIKF